MRRTTAVNSKCALCALRPNERYFLISIFEFHLVWNITIIWHYVISCGCVCWNAILVIYPFIQMIDTCLQSSSSSSSSSFFFHFTGAIDGANAKQQIIYCGKNYVQHCTLIVFDILHNNNNSMFWCDDDSHVISKYWSIFHIFRSN